MRERPIFFNGLMLRALLAGHKTQTRRLVKLPRDTTASQWKATPAKTLPGSGALVPSKVYSVLQSTSTRQCILPPHGHPGDHLWVREGYQAANELPGAMRSRGDFVYAADQLGWAHRHPRSKWCSSIDMPREASRITLEIRGMRAERLLDITEEDATAEGLLQAAHESGREQDALSWFRSQWNTMHGLASWDVNPWVWVIEFGRVVK